MSIAGLGVGAVALLLALSVLLGATEVVVARGRVQTAADAAALAAVAAAPLAGGDGAGCAAAREAAAANGAALVRCDGPRGGWALRAAVTVRVTGPGLARLGPGVRAHATAILEPMPADGVP